MVRTTLNLDAAVLAELKRRASKEGRSLGELASCELEKAFKADRPARQWPPEGWVSQDMGALFPVDDTRALWDFLDGEAYGVALGRHD